MWDPAQYAKFAAERSRPFADLLAQVRVSAPKLVVDLGCGTGQLSKTLAERWPTAHVVGVDNSPAMLEKASLLAIPGRLEFVDGDLASWTAAGPVDVIISNAALHWAKDHDHLLDRLAGMLAPGGTLQMPNAFQDPGHLLIEETAAVPRWRKAIGPVPSNRGAVMPLAWYVHKLHRLGISVDAWETTYIHVLTGENPVLEWLMGTTLRPVLQLLQAEETREFLAELGPRLRLAYPATGDVTLFPFPRLFFVATRVK